MHSHDDTYSDLIVRGDKLHIITRRLFAEDVRRHFAGEVQRSIGDLCEIRGYAFVFNASRNEWRRRPELRTRIISIADSVYVINKLPHDIEIDTLEYRIIDKRLVVTGEGGFTLDINEFGVSN